MCQAWEKLQASCICLFPFQGRISYSERALVEAHWFSIGQRRRVQLETNHLEHIRSTISHQWSGGHHQSFRRHLQGNIGHRHHARNKHAGFLGSYGRVWCAILRLHGEFWLLFSDTKAFKERFDLGFFSVVWGFQYGHVPNSICCRGIDEPERGKRLSN